MIFSSQLFVIFLCSFLLLYSISKNKRYRLGLILLSSVLFYTSWNFHYIWIILFSAVVDYYASLLLFRTQDPKRKKLLLAVSMAMNLGLLAYFKYFNFFLDSANGLLSLFDCEEFDHWNILLPVGISFYTFQTMSYTIDVYRGNTKPSNNFFHFFGYVIFFPQLVAGPIVRYEEYEKDYGEVISSHLKADNISEGIKRFIEGFLKKIFIADQLALISDKAFAHPDLDMLSAWIGVFAYTFQIYYDFAGYSDMGIGVARIVGFRFPENFDRPYHASNIQEFWRRWHMTLSRWLRDYLYISLGGNRKGILRTKINLVLTMLLGGLWHGASWNFVIWGGVHGLWLLLHRILEESKSYLAISIRFQNFAGIKVHKAISVFVTFIFVSIIWVFFRSQNLRAALNYFRSLAGISHPSYTLNPFTKQIFGDQVFSFDKQIIFSLVLLAGILLYQLFSESINYQKRIRKQPAVIQALFYFFLISIMMIFTFTTASKPFIYFQF